MSNENRLPRAAALHDLSCVGRCALTVILPTLAAMGIQPIPLPTALLSTHTGGFTDLFFADLTEEMEKIAAHWKTLGMDFDAIYTGFLGSAPQIDTVSRFIAEFGEGALILVDPVMGDDGLLYSTYTTEMVDRVRELCAHADLITPNLTEACFLCGVPYRDTTAMNEAEVNAFAHELLDRLAQRGAPAVLLTGLPHGDVMTVAGAVEGERFIFSHERISAGYPGTGDLFASVLLGRLMGQNGPLTAPGLQAAAESAAHFTGRAIARTLEDGNPVRDGVLLEALLGELI